jgi:GGDEF domain-containing protein
MPRGADATAAAWLEAADAACYEAKRRGRGQARMAAAAPDGALPVG